MLKYISTADFQSGKVIPYLGTPSEFTKVAQENEAYTEAKDYLLSLPRDDKYFYCLVVALGAGEYWGPNRNGDYFPEADLIKSYHTFKDGHVFELHQNDDPSKSIGHVLEAFWNDRLKRVELVIAVDREKGAKYLERLEKGEPVDVSMGCKVDYDVCSICGNKSKTRADYCEHLRYHMNEVLPDGRQVYAINPNPQFFDISFVRRGADPTAKVLMKVAQVEKGGAIDKEVPAMAVTKLSPKQVADYIARANAELNNAPDIPREVLDKMLERWEPHDIMIALARAGIPLKVTEVRYIIADYPIENVTPDLLRKLILTATEKLDPLLVLPRELIEARSFAKRAQNMDSAAASQSMPTDQVYDAYQQAIVERMVAQPSGNVLEFIKEKMKDPKFQRLATTLALLVLNFKILQELYRFARTFLSLEYGPASAHPMWKYDIGGAWEQASSPYLAKSAASKLLTEQHGNLLGGILLLGYDKYYRNSTQY